MASELKERVSQSTNSLHLLFRQLSNDDISNDQLIDALYELGLYETSDLTSFLRKRETSSFKFRDFLSALSNDSSLRNLAETPTVVRAKGPSSSDGGIFASMSNDEESQRGKATRVGGRSAVGGVSDAMNFNASNGGMYETSSGAYGGTASSYYAKENVEDRPTRVATEKSSGYSSTTKSLSCPWGVESDLASSRSASSKYKAQPSSGNWFADVSPAPKKSHTASTPIWGTDADM